MKDGGDGLGDFALARAGRPCRRAFLGGVTALTGLFAGRALRALDAAPRRPRLLVERAGTIPPAPRGGSIDFLVVGDTGGVTPERDAVAAAMSACAASSPVAFVVMTGDNVYPRGVASAHDPQLERCFAGPFRAPGLDVPFYPCLGNHDHEGSVQAQIDYTRVEGRWTLPAAFHSFRAAAGGTSAEVFVLDTTPLRLRPILAPFDCEQVAWLGEGLRRSDAAWKIVVGHHPLCSGGPKGGSSKVRWWIESMLELYGADLVLSGHNHDLELIDPGGSFLQLVSGAGSGPGPVRPTRGTLCCAEGGGFARVSLRPCSAWIELFSAERGALAAFRVVRESGGFAGA